MIPRKARKNKF